MKKKQVFYCLIASLLLATTSAHAFCGFYVAKADANLYNKASQVVMARHEDKTVISMMNDYEGDLKNFALVVPVPEVLKEGQINVGNKKLFERIDAFSAPRLVEYFDEDPCRVRYYEAMELSGAPMLRNAMPVQKTKAKRDLGVKVEAKYTVGEYDIVILSAKESNGLETWLIQNNYNIPKGARKALKPYIKQKMKFFVAKVNLDEQTKTGLKHLRPLQFAFQSEKFMLPIRLGMINANGPQELLVYVLTKKGRVETTNYRTQKLPSDVEIPAYVKQEFGDFYKAMFDTQVEKEKMKTVFTEYFWNMGWCDPCAAEPLTPKELKKLGVFWLEPQHQNKPTPRIGIIPPRPTGPVPVMVTRLHLRYTNKTFPEDLMFQETSDTQNFQGRYILQHAWKGNQNECAAAEDYFTELPKRKEKRAQTLANLTSWDINEIREKMDLEQPKPSNWWDGLWN